ncbi:MAG TPA: class I mannose-6-phosphate isomerase [Sphingomonadaceae bacterium]|nr:class I mannose-6-phosphate isomerase [Sphingomonadaceae bacterium]
MSALLPVRTVEKPWGVEVPPEPFTADAGKKIGEIWFEPPPELATLLVKYIFTSEKLSVQVHPGGDGGKEECWLVIDAEPGATLGIGFKQPLDSEAMRAAALDGSIEHLLEWHQVRPGDFFYIPAGTVHAIGAGVSVIEVQQNADITYRLYDYGRPRELHLDEGLAVAKGAPHDSSLRSHLPEHGSLVLLDGPHFRLDRVDGTIAGSPAERYRGPLLVIPVEGEASVAGTSVAPGECAMALSLDEVRLAEDGQCLLAQPCRSEA